MNLTSIELPPVSKRFYDTLVRAFPELDPADINESTSMIKIQRNAAQQEVIRYIQKAVRNDGGVYTEPNVWERIRYVFFKR